jgi:hypothetical protein
VSQVIKMHASLYDPEAVKSAAEAYGELAKIVVTVEEDRIEVAFDECDPEVPDLVDEFCNHALHETVIRARTASEGT